MRIRFNKRGFTLAEIMIVLMVIGIISAILLPIAHHATPDENVLKFKKANATLGNVIRELVTSDKYYLDGDLGVKPDGSLVDSPTYFCETFADLVNAKSVNCADTKDGYSEPPHIHLALENGIDNTSRMKNGLDVYCLDTQKEEILTTDNITYYSPAPYYTYAVSGYWTDDPLQRLYGCIGCYNDTIEYDADGNTIGVTNNSPFDLIYKPFCIDIDGINQGEDPFGYGIRADGKIIYGTRAEEWMKKSIQNKD